MAMPVQTEIMRSSMARMYKLDRTWEMFTIPPRDRGNESLRQIDEYQNRTVTKIREDYLGKKVDILA